jgi:hypothetical protein
VVALGVLLCGTRCPLAFCGTFGRKEIIEISKTARGHWKSLNLFYSLHTWTAYSTFGDKFYFILFYFVLFSPSR